MPLFWTSAKPANHSPPGEDTPTITKRKSPPKSCLFCARTKCFVLWDSQNQLNQHIFFAHHRDRRLPSTPTANRNSKPIPHLKGVPRRSTDSRLTFFFTVGQGSFFEVFFSPLPYPAAIPDTKDVFLFHAFCPWQPHFHAPFPGLH